MTTLSLAVDRGARRRRPLAALTVLVIGWSFAIAAQAADVKVLTAAAFKPVLSAVAPVFEQRTGHRLVLVDDAAAALAQAIRDGAEFDLVVLPAAELEALGQEGAVSDGSIIALARAAAGPQEATVYAGAVSTAASHSQAALSLLILLASEDTQALLKVRGLAAP
jgi:molybdate transport system substrate-binding protein